MLTVLLFAFFFFFLFLLSTPPHAYIHFFIPPPLAVQHLEPEHMHFPWLPPLFYHPCIGTYIYNDSFSFFFLSLLAATLLSLPPTALVVFVLCFSHLSLLLTRVKTSPPPWAPTTAQPICYSNIFLNFFFRKIVTWCVPWQHKSPCKLLYTWWTVLGELFKKKKVLFITHWRKHFTNYSAAEVVIYISHYQRRKRHSNHLLK